MNFCQLADAEGGSQRPFIIASHLLAAQADSRDNNTRIEVAGVLKAGYRGSHNPQRFKLRNASRDRPEHPLLGEQWHSERKD